MNLLKRRELMGKYIGASGNPYSMAVTVALQTAFSAAQWEIIRIYGIVHPEIVGYMNAYAAEDPKIAYSLVAGLGIRTLENNAATEHNYILTGIIPTNDISVEFELIYRGLKQTNNYNVLYGSSPRGNTTGGQTFYAYIKANATAYSFCHSEGLQDLTMTFTEGARLKITENIPNVTIIEDGTTYSKDSGKTQFASTPVNQIAIFENFRNGAITNDPQVIAGAISFKIHNNGTDYWFVPFIRDNKKGLLEMIGGTFFENGGTGTFTELIETPTT